VRHYVVSHSSTRSERTWSRQPGRCVASLVKITSLDQLVDRHFLMPIKMLARKPAMFGGPGKPQYSRRSLPGDNDSPTTTTTDIESQLRSRCLICRRINRTYAYPAIPRRRSKEGLQNSMNPLKARDSLSNSTLNWRAGLALPPLACGREFRKPALL